MAGFDASEIDDSDYAVGEMTPELQAEYDAKMAEYYDYDNYEANYAAYGSYNYDDYEATAAPIGHPCDNGSYVCHTDAICTKEGLLF
jgi:hypothetical protein